MHPNGLVKIATEREIENSLDTEKLMKTFLGKIEKYKYASRDI